MKLGSVCAVAQPSEITATSLHIVDKQLCAYTWVGCQKVFGTGCLLVEKYAMTATKVVYFELIPNDIARDG